MLRAIILACTFFVGAQARIAPFGCPTVTPKPGVQYNRLTGKWFEYLRYFDSDRVLTKCASYDMTLQAVDTELEIETTVVKRLSEDTRSSTTRYTIGTSTEGILRPSDGPNLILLETDYTNYAVFYTCENLTPFNLFRRGEGTLTIQRHGENGKACCGNPGYLCFSTKPRDCSLKQAAVMRFSLKSDDLHDQIMVGNPVTKQLQKTFNNYVIRDGFESNLKQRMRRYAMA